MESKIFFKSSPSRAGSTSPQNLMGKNSNLDEILTSLNSQKIKENYN
jgi:hypothetical protein